MKISLILLAAGNSRRFGGNKLLYEWNGKPMYRHIVDEIESLDDTVFAEKIVVSQYEEILSDLKQLGWKTAINHESELGISRSIHLGIAAGIESDAWCFAVADQPYLRAETVGRFTEMFRKSGKRCGCVRCRERTGNPCIFTKYFEKELLRLRGDAGGKKIIKANMGECFFFEVGDERELEDIDIQKGTPLNEKKGHH